jgi:AcrR family transcriptional regulator
MTVESAVESAAPSEAEWRWARTVEARATRAHGRRTLAKLLDAAVEEFAAHGWHGARMARLAKRAGTAHGTVYAYFADKDDLLFALRQDADVEMQVALRAMPELLSGPDGFSSLRSWVAEVCKCFRRYAPVAHAVGEAMADEENSRTGRAAMRDQRDVLAVFEERIRSASPGLDAPMVALCIYALLEGSNEAVYLGELMVTEDELVAGIAEFVQRSIFGADAAQPQRSA